MKLGKSQLLSLSYHVYLFFVKKSGNNFSIFHGTYTLCEREVNIPYVK